MFFFFFCYIICIWMLNTIYFEFNNNISLNCNMYNIYSAYILVTFCQEIYIFLLYRIICLQKTWNIMNNFYDILMGGLLWLLCSTNFLLNNMQCKEWHRSQKFYFFTNHFKATSQTEANILKKNDRSIIKVYNNKCQNTQEDYKINSLD